MLRATIKSLQRDTFKECIDKSKCYSKNDYK